MHLPEILESGRGMQCLHDFGLSAFASAIVHDGYTRTKGVNEYFRIRSVHAVMETQEHINGPDAVTRAHQFEFLVLRQIPQMNRPKPSEGHVGSDRHRVLRIVLSRLEIR